MIDERRYLEREAREQGEREYRLDMRMRGLCADCGGSGQVMTGWTAAGLSPIWGECEECCGTGDATILCPFCGHSSHAKACPPLRALLMGEG